MNVIVQVSMDTDSEKSTRDRFFPPFSTYEKKKKRSFTSSTNHANRLKLVECVIFITETLTCHIRRVRIMLNELYFNRNMIEISPRGDQR